MSLYKIFIFKNQQLAFDLNVEKNQFELSNSVEADARLDMDNGKEVWLIDTDDGLFLDANISGITLNRKLLNLEGSEASKLYPLNNKDTIAFGDYEIRIVDNRKQDWEKKVNFVKSRKKQTATSEKQTATSEKLIMPAFLLCFFFGFLGIHRFYVGKIGTGILQLVTLGGLGLWTLIDLIIIIVGAFTDKEGKKITQWT